MTPRSRTTLGSVSDCTRYRGNFLCTPDGRLCVLDMGLMTEVCTVGSWRCTVWCGGEKQRAVRQLFAVQRRNAVDDRWAHGCRWILKREYHGLTPLHERMYIRFSSFTPPRFASSRLRALPSVLFFPRHQRSQRTSATLCWSTFRT